MAETSQNGGLVKKVVLHMYNSVVVGSINSLAALLRLKTLPGVVQSERRAIRSHRFFPEFRPQPA